MNNPDHPRAGHVLRNLENKHPGRREIISQRLVLLAILALVFAGAYALDASR